MTVQQIKQTEKTHSDRNYRAKRKKKVYGTAKQKLSQFYLHRESRRLLEGAHYIFLCLGTLFFGTLHDVLKSSVFFGNFWP